MKKQLMAERRVLRARLFNNSMQLLLLDRIGKDLKHLIWVRRGVTPYSHRPVGVIRAVGPIRRKTQ